MDFGGEREFYEIPVEMILHKEQCDMSMQTDDLGSDVRVIEVPVEMNIVEDDEFFLGSVSRGSGIREIDNEVEFSQHQDLC